MTNIFKLHQQKPLRLGHKKVQTTKKTRMENKGQLNLFNKPSSKIIQLPQKKGPFEQALKYDENGSAKAREFYLKAIEIEDCKADAYCNLGILEANDNQYARAIDYFTRALALEPRHYEAHFNLANLYFDKENLNLAELHYETAREIEPADPNIYFNLGLVQAMRGDVNAAITSLSTYSKMVGKQDALKANELVTNLSLSKK